MIWTFYPLLETTDAKLPWFSLAREMYIRHLGRPNGRTFYDSVFSLHRFSHSGWCSEHLFSTASDVNTLTEQLYYLIMWSNLPLAQLILIGFSAPLKEVQGPGQGDLGEEWHSDLLGYKLYSLTVWVQNSYCTFIVLAADTTLTETSSILRESRKFCPVYLAQACWSCMILSAVPAKSSGFECCLALVVYCPG